MKTLLSLVTSIVLLPGCANFGAQAEANKLAEQKQLAVIIAKTGKSQVFITDIPSANNFISDQLIVAALKAGTLSNSAQALLKVLQQSPSATVAVTGKAAALMRQPSRQHSSALRPCPPTRKPLCCLSAMVPTPTNSN